MNINGIGVKMIKETILELASQRPEEFGKGIDIISSELSTTPVVPEDLTEAISMLELALQNPETYPEMVQAAIADGLIDEGDAPAQFDAIFIISLLLSLYGLQDRLNAEGFSRGGLTVAGRKAAMGQGGDSMLAHINPREAEILRRMGGQGTVNPNTGLIEYKSLKKVFKKVLPVALAVFAPGLGSAIGGAIGFSGTTAAIVGGGLLGAGTAALTGGDPLKGALFGGVGAGLGDVVGGFVDEGLNLGLSAPAAATLGSGLVGGVAGELVGDGFLQGAVQGAGGQLLKNLAPAVPGGPKNTLDAVLQSGAKVTGDMLTAGYDPKDAIVGGATAGIFGGAKQYFKKPSETVVSQIKETEITPEGVEEISIDDLSVDNNPLLPGDSVAVLPGDTALLPGDTTPKTGFFGKALNYATENPVEAGLLGLTALSAFEAPDDILEAAGSLSADQQEYFNRPSVSWDWDSLRRDANNKNMSLSAFMATEWPTITSGKYDNTGGTGYNQGGPLSYIRGKGTGRSDEIPAYLSDGEYVIDAETVSMLGDGSNKAGASVLDKMREEIRSHKGKKLVKGKFSADAKSPLQYIKGVA